MTDPRQRAHPVLPLDDLQDDEIPGTRPRRERASGTRIAVPSYRGLMAPAAGGDALLALATRALESASSAATDAEIVAVHLDALLSALPGRLVAARVASAGTRAVEIAHSNVPFTGGSDLVLRFAADGRRCVLASGIAGFDVALEARGEVFGAVTVEYPAGPGQSPDAAVLARDTPAATHLATQLAALLSVGREHRAKASLIPARVIPLTPVDTRGIGNELRALFDGTREVIAVLDRAGTIRSGNLAIARMFACEPDRLAGRTFTELVEPGDRRRLGGSLWSALQGETSQIEVAMTLPDGGGPKLMALSFSPVRDAADQVLGVITLGRDVTDQRIREEQFARADKLATVGRLAASVAHEINNPLTAILAYSEAMARQLEASGDARGALRVGRIVEAAERIRSLARRLLAYTPSVVEQTSVLTLGDVAQQAVQLCEHVVRDRGVEVRVDATPGTPLVLGFRGELAQVFVNLITNACHAAPGEGGRIDVTVGPSESGRVCAVVRDNGHGVAPDDLTRIFEPFYTTRGSGQGTGLGLSIVRTILEQHQATLSVESTVGTGTAFIMEFPAYAGEAR